MYIIPDEIKNVARGLRKNMTKAENLLWNELRNSKLGVKFLGSIHDCKEILELDREKEKLLEDKGINIIRIKNEEVYLNLDFVLKTIKENITISI